MADLTVNTGITVTPKHLYNDGIWAKNITISPNVELNLDVLGTAIMTEKSLALGEGSKLNITTLAPHYAGAETEAGVIYVKDGNASIRNAEINIDAGADPEFFEPYGKYIGAFHGIRVEGGLFAENSHININMWAKKGDKPYASTFTGMVTELHNPIELTSTEVNVTIHSEDIYNANGLYTSGALTMKDSTVSVDLQANDRIRGIFCGGEFTVTDSDVEVNAEELSGAKTYGIIAGESYFSLSGSHRIHSAAANGIGFCADTLENGAADREYEEGYQSAHIFLNDKTECLVPDNYLISLTSIEDPFVYYEYYETYYEPEDTSAPAAEVLIAANEPEYTYTDGTEHFWKTGSSDGLDAVVKRGNNDSHAFEKFTGIQVDGTDVSASDYTAEEGSVRMMLKPEYLSTLDFGSHTLTSLFEDGSADTQFTIGSETPEITIFITGNSVSSVYNGNEQTAEGFEVSCASSLFDENDLSLKDGVIYEASGRDAGIYYMGLSPDSFVYSDKTVGAVLVVEDGTLMISPAPLTVRTGSASKYYDGKPLYNSQAKLSGLVNGETAEVKATGSQTAVGSSKNTYAISWDTAKKTNYIIIEKLGILTVREKGSSSDSGSSPSSAGGQYSYSPQVINTADSHEISHWARTLVISICTAILSAWMMKQNRL